MKKNNLSNLILFVILTLSSSNVFANKSNTEKAGDVLAALIPATAYGSTYVFDDSEGRKQFYKSFVTNVGVTLVLKASVNKTRPDKSNNHSFPSGHTSFAFQGAAFIDRRYGLKLGIPAYIGASYVAYSRVHSNKHYNSDVLAGAALGYLSSRYFTSPYKNLSINTTTRVANSNAIGLNLSYQW